MKYQKILGLIAVTAVFVLGSTASSDATILTSPKGTQLGLNSIVTAATPLGSGVKLAAPTGPIECKKSEIISSVWKEGGPTETVALTVGSLTFGECNCEVKVLVSGSLEVHTEGETANSNGTVTGIGQELTTSCNGFHCIWSTGFGTDLGKIAGGSFAVLTFKANLPRTGGRSGAFCGSSAPLSGTYEVIFPLFVD